MQHNRGSQEPYYILPNDASRTTGKDAQRLNIAAAKLVAQTVRTTLGPKGMDKMLVDATGNIIVTNDGVTILEEMEIDHPSAKMIVEVAKTQESEVGDGTTTAVVLAGEMLKNAERLLDKEIHPTIIAKGYHLAASRAQEILTTLAKNVTIDDDKTLKKIAHTAMTGKGAEDAKEHLSRVVVDAIKTIAHKGLARREDIKLERRMGGRVDETRLIQGIVLDKGRAHNSMPEKITKAKIALLDTALEIKNTEIESRINISDPDKLQGFFEMEEEMIKKMIKQLKAAGANVVFCQRGIDDLAQYYLAKEGILAARRVKKTDLQRLARATGGAIINNLAELSAADLGSAGEVFEERHAQEGLLYVQECPKARAVTILVRGGTEHVIDEIRRALEDAIGDVTAAINDGAIVAGAGAPELELARGLTEYAASLSGREQLAVQAFADSLEIIPTTLAENAGLDPIDALTALKAAHENGEATAGINVASGEYLDAWVEGVLEPLKIKTQAVSSAADVAIMILRIDDVIAAGGAKTARKTPSEEADEL